jgi:hypothetical protein
VRKVAFACLVVASVAHAEPRASAVELFAHGRALAAEGKCAEAIPFFLDTLKLEPSIGALLNLADCHEKLHDDARAYTRYREAESLAREKGDDRETLAAARANAIGAHVPRIAVTAPSGVRVTLDGTEAHAGENVVTGGDHVVRASAEGKTTWERTVHATAGRAEPVVVPDLRPIAIESKTHPPNHAQRPIGIVVTLVGAATLVTAGIFGGLAVAKKNDELTLAAGPSQAAFDDAKSSAHAFGDASTALFIAGGVMTAVGIVVWLTAPRSEVTLGARTLTFVF